MKPVVAFAEIVRRLDRLDLPRTDLVVGIAESGAVAASLVAERAGCSLAMLKVAFRRPDNRPMYKKPRLCGRKICLPAKARRILLVDDVSVSGKTLIAARRALAGKQVRTLVLAGRADYVLFPEIDSCVSWPWKP